MATYGSSSPSEFSVVTTYVGFEAVLAVRGEVDVRTAPGLKANLDAAIDAGHRFVVLDLADLDFMDGSGLHVIAKCAGRLALAGGALTVRSPTAMVCRMLDIVGLANLIRLEHTVLIPAVLGPEETVKLDGVLTQAMTQGKSHHPRRVSAFPTDDQLVDSTLRLVVALAHATVEGANGVSVTLRRRGHLATVAATDETISDMDANQYATHEGPCIDASVEGRWFHATSLDTETRWPAFIPRAKALGINAILSSPLLDRDQPIGALNIYSRRAMAFGPEDQELASVFAAEASTVLTDIGVHGTDDQLATRFQEALRTREIIAQAQGVIMARDGVEEDSAYSTLLRLSIDSDRPLRSGAEDLLTSTLRPPPDADPLLKERFHG